MSEKKGFFKSFKEFAIKGNVVDMAVGVIIGGAFGKIVTSLVNDIIMPALGLLIGNISFSELAWVIAEPTETEPGISIAYGSFIQNVLDFLIIALSIFCVISAMKKNSEKKSEKKRKKKPGCLKKPRRIKRPAVKRCSIRLKIYASCLNAEINRKRFNCLCISLERDFMQTCA